MASEPLDSAERLAHRVFDTYELLEMVLQQLPMRDVLLAQRVSKTWKKVISQSQSLQRKLFFKPASIIAPDYDVEGEYEFGFTPLPLTNVHADHTSTSFQMPGGHTVVMNRLLRPCYSLNQQYQPPEKTVEFPKGRACLPERFLYSSASWKRMLLTRPALTDILMNDHLDGHDMVHNASGVTAGDIYRKVRPDNQNWEWTCDIVGSCWWDWATED